MPTMVMERRARRIASAQRRKNNELMENLLVSYEDTSDLNTLHVAMAYDDGTRYTSDDVRRELGL